MAGEEQRTLLISSFVTGGGASNSMLLTICFTSATVPGAACALTTGAEPCAQAW